MSSIEVAVQEKIDELYGGFTWASRVKSKIDRRACEGVVHYGYTLDREDLPDVDWIEHAEDELLDALNYIEKMISTKKNGESRKWHLERMQRRLIDVLYMFEFEFSRDLIESGK